MATLCVITPLQLYIYHRDHLHHNDGQLVVISRRQKSASNQIFDKESNIINLINEDILIAITIKYKISLCNWPITLLICLHETRRGELLQDRPLKIVSHNLVT